MLNSPSLPIHQPIEILFSDRARVRDDLAPIEAKSRESEARIQCGKLCQSKKFLLDGHRRGVVPIDDEILVELLKMLNDTAGKHCVRIHKQESAPRQFSHHP